MTEMVIVVLVAITALVLSGAATEEAAVEAEAEAEAAADTILHLPRGVVVPLQPQAVEPVPLVQAVAE